MIKNKTLHPIRKGDTLHEINQSFHNGTYSDVASRYLAEIKAETPYTIDEVRSGINSANSQFILQISVLQKLLSELPQNIITTSNFKELLSLPVMRTAGNTEDFVESGSENRNEIPYTIDEVRKEIDSANFQYTSQIFALQDMLSEVPQNITSSDDYKTLLSLPVMQALDDISRTVPPRTVATTTKSPHSHRTAPFN